MDKGNRKAKGNKRRMGRKESLKTYIQEHKAAFVWYMILRILVIAALVAQFINGNYENVFLCVLTLILFLIPNIIESKFHIDVPDTLEVIILLFIFAAQILGEINSFYITYPFWDTILHTVNGFLAAAIGFSLVDILNRNETVKFNLSPIFLAVGAFCFSMTIGVLWEFFECAMDLLLGFDMQKDTVIHTISTVMLDPDLENKVITIKDITQTTINGVELGLGGYLDIGLLDTMKDLAVNFIGALVFSIIGYFYVKKRGKGYFAKHFIPTLKRKKKAEEQKEQEHETNAIQDGTSKSGSKG